MAASAAATVSTIMAKICPTRSPWKAEKATRLIFTASSINSIDIENDDDVLAVEEDAENAEREQDRGDGEVVGQADGHDSPLPEFDLDQLDRLGAGAPHLAADILTLHVPLVMQREHDGADHGDQQNEARHLEQIDVARIEDEPERLGVADIGGRRRRRLRRDVRRCDPGAKDQDQLDEEQEADGGADRQIFDEARAELGEIDIEHHDHEQEQHHHRADIDHDQNHRQELGAEQHEETRGVEEGEDQKQHSMHGVLRGDDHEAGADADGGEQIEEECT